MGFRTYKQNIKIFESIVYFLKLKFKFFKKNLRLHVMNKSTNLFLFKLS